jgi:thiosulfate reductase cytochrome b subunit
MKGTSSAYPLWLRLWHWTNAFLFVTLLITGLTLHYARPGTMPEGFRTDVLLHNTAGILLTLFYGLFLYGNLRLGNGRYYKVLSGDIEPGLLRQTGYYLWGIFLGSPHPYPHSEERKFNPLQKLFYLGVMYLLFPCVVITGWALLFPDRLPEQLLGVPGIGLWALAHTYIGFLLSLFMVVHIYLGTTGPTLGALFHLMWFGETSHSQAAPPVPGPDLRGESGKHDDLRVTAAKEQT